MIRVAIRAPSPLVRAGLASLLREHPALRVLEPGAEDSDGPPDVVLAAPGPGGDSAAEALADEAGGAPVVLLVSGALGERDAAPGDGVMAVLPEDATGEQLAAAIAAVAAGLVVAQPSDLGGWPAARAGGARDGTGEALTAREREVLRLLAEGLSNKAIADRLAISDRTAKFHVASIMGKLGASSRTEAVTIGIRRGLVLI